MTYSIEIIPPSMAQEICQDITADLPEYFGLPEVNKHYVDGMLSRTSFGVKVDGQWVGLLTIEFPYPQTGQIYWMGIKRSFHGKGYGTHLIKRASFHAMTKGAHTLMVETLSPEVGDENYLKTYEFYHKRGFQPLFNCQPRNYDYPMVYMAKTLSLSTFTFVDLTHSLHADIPTWDGSCGFHLSLKGDYDDCPGNVKFCTQSLAMHGGIGTHMDAPKHCIPGGKDVSEIDLCQFIVPWVVLDVSGLCHERYSLLPADIDHFESLYGPIPTGCFVFVYTGWSQFWDAPERYRNNYVFPSISKEAGEILLQRGIVGMGIDTLSPDRLEDGFPVHQLLLEAGKYILENVANGEKLPPVGSYGVCLPLKIKDGCEAPVRLMAMIPRETS